jgi:NADPH:quinone reductase-like Zn-dependent oxidoreductase
MKAITYTQYGSPDVLHLTEVEKPGPKDNEVLVKVHAASANPADWHTMRATPFLARLVNGLFKPKNPRLGADVAGRVEAVGRNVTQFHVGDEVFGCLSLNEMGSFAEYICAAEDAALALKPANMTFEQAAAVPLAAFTALQGLRDTGHIHAGQTVLINGASGGVGTSAVQIAKSYGAEVTGVCSTRNMELVRSIGADHVIDYTQEDYTLNGQTYDVICDVFGKSSVSRSIKSLKPNGRYLLANPSLSQRVRGRWAAMRSNKQVIVGAARQKTEDLIFLRELIEAGKIKSVIDRCYPLEQTAEAHRYVETGQKKGHVVITMEHDNKT